MDFNLSEEQQSLREEIIRFARNELNNGVIERDRAQLFPRDLWLKCGEMGLQGLPVPREFGGVELDPLSTAIALEALGYGCEDGGLVFAICAHLLACVVPVWKHGSPAQKERYLPGMCNGSLIAVNGTTETASGSDVYSMTTTARREGNQFVLNGAKTFSSNGPEADLALIYAATDKDKGYRGGISAFLVEKGTAGFRNGQRFEKMGLRTCSIGELLLEEVRVSEGALLGDLGTGALIFSESMAWERICLVASHVGTMARLLDQAVEYARTRKTAGQPIGKLQAISHRIADMKVRLEASRLLVYKAAAQIGETWEIDREAAIAKLHTSEALVKTAMDTMQILGGYGFMVDYGVERALRDAMASTIYSGTSEVQRNIIARWLGL